MSRDQWIGILVAVVLHAAIFWGLRISRPPVPLPLGNDPMQVDLVAAAPGAPAPDAAPQEAAAEAAPEAEPSPAPVVPKPEPTPEVPPPPTLAPAPPLPSATPQPTPRPHPSPKPAAKPITRKSVKPSSSPTKRSATKPSTAAKKSGSDTAHSGAPVAGGRGDSAPGYRSNPQPPYPDEARRLGQEGLVMLDVLVSAEGRAVKVTLERSSGVRTLDQAAISAVRRWSFQPGRVAGVPVAAHVDVPIRFRLDR